MVRQRRPSGRSYRIDKAWQDRIRARLAERGISQAQLARMIGASPGSITLIFKPSSEQSRLVAAIHRKLDLEPPPDDTVVAEPNEQTALRRERDRIWNELTDEQRELLLNIGRQMRRS
jgi:transcriptional regulator with XRE-family HTH domain